jgi:metal-dependent hydrolase (beta-lactamase superfamily II)
MRLKYQQKFHSVGQGLFYSSSLRLNNNLSANVVFDCGSENTELINKRIDEFNNYNKTNINVLIISHLHYDHVSGLDHLLKSKKINTVILPYLSPEERLLLEIYNNLKRPEWYFEFLSNPYTYLSNNESIEKVIIINGDDKDSDEPQNLPDDLSRKDGNLINEGGFILALKRQMKKQNKILVNAKT